MKPHLTVLALAFALDVAAQGLAPVTALPVRVTPGQEVVILANHGAVSRPDFSPRNRVCVAAAGDDGEVVHAVMAEGANESWLQVRFTIGACAQQAGWMSSQRLARR